MNTPGNLPVTPSAVRNPRALVKPRAPLWSWFTLLFLASATGLVAQPVITSINPPVLTEHAGDHVAFTVAATGTAPLQYQWYQNGTLLTGQTNAWVTVTNIQTANSGKYAVAVGDASGLYATNSATLNVSNSYLPLYPTNLVVVRLGDGVQALSGATGNTIYLDQYTTNAVYVSTVQIPDEAPGQTYGAGSSKTVFGNPGLLLPGAGTDAANQGALTLSGNQQFLTLAGYQLAWPYTSTDVTAGGATYVRGIYTVNSYGFPLLAYTNYGLYSGGNHTIRAAVTLDGTNFWTTGQAGSVGGVKYVSITNAAYATGSGIPTIASSTTGTRVVQIANNNLIFSDVAASAGHGLWVVPGLPEPAANAAVTASQNEIVEPGLPSDFAISPDGQTIYIADSEPYGGTNTGGIERWDFNGSAYVLSYILPTSGTNGAQNLTVLFPSSIGSWGPGVTGASLYASLPAGGSIVSVTDNGAGSTAVPFLTAGHNQVLRGLRFGPSVSGGTVSVATQPTNQTAFVGSTVTFAVSASGAQPYSYQWQFNGANITNATQATLTLTNIQLSSGGTYTVVVSNPGNSVLSAAAVLTVVQGKPAFSFNPQSRVETVGDHTAFAVQVTGTLPISFQWYDNNAALPGATNAALVLTNIQTSAAGTYYVTATNIYGSVNSASASLGVTTGLQALSSNNLVVSRVGEGSQVLSASTGNTIYLDQFTTNGTYVSSIQLPDEGAGQPYGYGSGTNASTSVGLPPGSEPLLVVGAGPDAPYEALLTLSADKASLNLAGYVQAYPANVPDVTYSAETAAGNSVLNWRGIAGISTYGYYSLLLTNSGLYSGGNHTIRSATTDDGVNFWTTGQASAAGIKYANILVPNYATGIGVPVVTSSGTGTHVVQIINGNLAFSDALASPPGIYVGSGGGLPEPAPTGTAGSQLYLNEGGSPVDFAASPDGQTIYISDDGASAQPGGIERYDSNGGGGFTYSYTIATGTNGAGARGLTVSFPSGITTWGAGVTGAILFATTAESLNNRLIKVTDVGAGSLATTLATAGPNQSFSGIRFGPVPVPVALYNNPQSTNLIAGQSVTLSAKVTGSQPYSYQWQLNGTNVVGGTNAFLALNNIPVASAGSYTLTVSNALGSITSTAASVTVLPAPQFTGSTPLGSGQGFQLSFTGPAGYNYSIWTTTNLALTPIETNWTRVETGGTFSGGVNTYVDPGTNQNQFYIITVP